MIVGFRDGQSLPGPIDGWICGSEPGESEDDVFTSTAHDIEEMLLGDSFNVGVEGVSVVDCTGFVHSLIYVANGNGGGKFLGGESVFPDKLPVNARDVGTRVHQCGGVDDFESVRGGDQLNKDKHRFIRC